MLCVCDWEHFSSRLWVISYYIPYFFSFWVSPHCLSYANCKCPPPRLNHGFASQLLYRLVQHRRATQPPPVQLQQKPWPLTPDPCISAAAAVGSLLWIVKVSKEDILNSVSAFWMFIFLHVSFTGVCSAVVLTQPSSMMTAWSDFESLL